MKALNVYNSLTLRKHSVVLPNYKGRTAILSDIRGVKYVRVYVYVRIRYGTVTEVLGTCTCIIILYVHNYYRIVHNMAAAPAGRERWIDHSILL